MLLSLKSMLLPVGLWVWIQMLLNLVSGEVCVYFCLFWNLKQILLCLLIYLLSPFPQELFLTEVFWKEIFTMASAVLSSVPTTASRFALLQVDSGSGSDSEPGKGKGRNTGKSQTNKSTTNEKKREKRRKKKEQQQSEANEVAIVIISCLLSQ